MAEVRGLFDRATEADDGGCGMSEDGRRTGVAGPRSDEQVGTAPEGHREGGLRWVDLFGIDPDYCGGRDVNEWLDERRGDA